MARKKRLNVGWDVAVQRHGMFCLAQDFSRNTLRDYGNTFRLFGEWLAEVDPEALGDLRLVDVELVAGFMAALAARPVSRHQGVTAVYEDGSRIVKRSKKTLRNYHTGLSSLWGWALRMGFVDVNVVKAVEPPKVRRVPIRPLDADVVRVMIEGTLESRDWKRTRSGRSGAGVRTLLFAGERNRAIVGLFLDSLVRVEELCALEVGDVVFDGAVGGELHVRHGKGDKARFVPFQRRAGQWLAAWMAVRSDVVDAGSPLFVNLFGPNVGLAMNRNAVARMVRRLGDRAGVRCGPHLLRTTGACRMVENGVTVWELKKIMGHERIETTMRYVEAANVDLKAAMRRASALDSYRL